MESSVENFYKGEKMEELLREYFISSGYYVVRGVKLKHDDVEVTDVDLWLYKRVSSVVRNRTNVDIKNKKEPKALERIIWAKGIKEVLSLDNCVVATTDRKESTARFATTHGVSILDGNFLAKLRGSTNLGRYPEDIFLIVLAKEKTDSYKSSWKYIYEKSKARLVSELDFSGCNATLVDIKFFIEKVITSNKQEKEIACRAMYVLISHFLVILDFITKDISLTDMDRRKEKILDGFKFGNLGRKGVREFLSIAASLSGNNNNSESEVNLIFDNDREEAMTDFFAKSDTLRHLVGLAIVFEQLAFNQDFIPVDKVDTKIKSVLSVILDYHVIERRKLFGAFGDNSLNVFVEAT